MSTIPKYVPSLMPPFAKEILSVININVPSSGGSGSINMVAADHSQQLASIGLALARIAAYSISIAEVITLIVDPKGGIRVKDALDPYQYEIVSKALEANEIPSPPPPPANDTTTNTLGGTIAQTADLAGAAGTLVGALNVAEGYFGEEFDLSLLKIMPAGFGTSILAGSTIQLPDMTPGLQTIKSSIDIIATAMSIIADSLNKSVDVPSKALLMKSILSLFSVALNEQSIKAANREPPTPPDL